MKEFFETIGKWFINAMLYLEETAKLTLEITIATFTPPFRFRYFIEQIEYIGIQSMMIAMLTAIFTGAVMALQMAFSLKRFGADAFVANILSVSLVRELGPVLTGLMVGGRVGAGITAEVGSMQVTEQIDAIKALGADPVRELFVPKTLACMVVLPVLIVYADIIGNIAGMVVSTIELGVEPVYYMDQVFRILKISDFLGGVAKGIFFGLIIGVVGCYLGLKTKGGTVGVGMATTTSVVAIFLTILVADLFLTKLLMILFQV